ncbi:MULTISPECIES: xanthine dehydrogenase family protein molybdopterin-binding subunit [unclassified Beijerinckia]|uniref:xanthine dehydrogenase family protein molybdopterin-binding subunit n=1 Tax=unclassified Beijerinckia TaxID=2638183 RepID=UPI00089C89B2|nr:MULTISPECIES: xanthine dehydrogenase family protein molybdopterin-binding subunit [unclassified Beijerinckia]MDH7795605.1 carbon-monoxide dehydrogenase large subunit [Beijerinckia sp. GAS462]SEC08483.1 carbon-monoxide dehydrogenase large subunit [Beijerinckia sp. 28-YEA-48]
MVKHIGEPALRKEDERLITGRGQFADDITFPKLAHAHVLRSPHAHAAIRRIDTTTARAMPGVLAVLTGADVLEQGLKFIPHGTGGSRVGFDVPLRNLDGSERLITRQMPLPADRARYAGEAVAIVVAETLLAARDAAEAIEIDWEVLPAVVRGTQAVGADAPRLWDDVPSNLPLDAEIGDKAATDAAFAKAAHRVSFKSAIQRVTGVHMEPRACIGEWDPKAKKYTVHASHGIGVVQMRADIAHALDVALEQIRVIAPGDVGGNFGTRNATYPEFVLVAWAARLIGRPVKYVAERQDALLSDFQGRDLDIDMELALDAKGNFLAVRSVNTSNLGAHTASFVPLNKGSQLMTSLYRVPAAYVRARAAISNTPSTIPYRSAGRPEAMYAVERIIDLAARQCGFDRVELRRRNLIPPSQQPYRNPFGVVYDNGDYLGVMRRALELADWKGFEKRRREARKRGLYRGIAIANYIETTSGAPRERAEVTILEDGTVDVIIGTQASGQGHETSFSQVAAEWLGVPFEKVRVRSGDTDFVLAGGGSHSGRSMRHASIVIGESVKQIAEKARRLAAIMFQGQVEDIEFAEGACRVKGTDRTVTLVEMTSFAIHTAALPEDLRGPLKGACDRVTPGLAFPYGTAVCELDVDPETGSLSFARYTSVDDVGVAVNPMILHGQTHGGIAQGVGQALMEQCWYDAQDGQNLSASFMDYAMLRASDLPSFITDLSEVAATSHPHGMRPGGEGGTTPALGLTINAIVDALADFGVTHIEMPATPQRIWQAIQAAKQRLAS